MEQVSSRSRLGAPGALLQAAEELQERGLAVLDASPLKATCAAASKEALRLPPRLLRAAPTASDHKVSIADGLLGEDGTQQVASILDLTKESRLELPALKRLVEQSEQLCRDLSREGAELVPGNLATSEPLLLEACTPLSLTPALEELTEESAQYWSDLYGRQVYQVLLFLGPAEGSLHLQHFEGSASTKVAVGPGTLVLLRPDLLARHFEPIPGAMGRCFVFNTFLVSPAPRRQEGTLPPYARDLVDWCMHRLKTVKLLELDGDKEALSAIPASWLRAAHAEIAFGEQAAIAGSAVWTPGPDVEEPAGLELAAFAGADFVIEIPHTRFDLQEWLTVEEHDEQKMYCRHGTFVDGADMFDHKFFGIAEKQVRTMPLSERWGLEVGYEALFRAGYTKQSLRRLKGDVLVGMHTTENQLNYRTPEARSFGIGGSQAREANLLSFYLNLIGQSIVFDTDGSSSFAALHHAQMEQSAEQNEPPEFGRGAPFSLVLSTFLNVSPACFVNFCLRGLTDVRGRCFAFDSSAKGLVRGEGSAALVLRRLFGTSKEGSDTDVREGLVRAVEMIQSPAASLTHASEVAMQETVDLALARSSCRAYGIDWVECHAAGDALADALEARACWVILDEGRAPAPSTPTASRTWSMTDYKTSIGSTYAAAGLLSLLRSLHCARLTLLPGSPMLRQMNPLVDEALSSLSFPTEPMALRTLYATQTGLALVNSFGSSGSLASAVIWADVGEALPKLAPARASPPKTWR